MKNITSSDNPTYRRLLTLLEASGVRKHGEYLLAGRKLVPEFLEQPAGEVKALISTEAYRDACEQILVAAQNGASNINVIELPNSLFKQLDAHGTHFPLLWGAAPELPVANLSQPPQNLELLLALANPLNLGAALRSAEAFSVEHVVLLKECANPFLSKVLRASSGSALRLRLSIGPSIEELANGPQSAFWALDKRGGDISKHRFTRDFRLLIGEEGLGIPDAVANERCLAIPMKPGMDSLNAVAATSIALYAYRAQWPI